LTFAIKFFNPIQTLLALAKKNQGKPTFKPTNKNQE
tara:strand:+ start:1479 stop:1586 length:108 start_codon:yes stop_codon:yes gene_type:complete